MPDGEHQKRATSETAANLNVGVCSGRIHMPSLSDLQEAARGLAALSFGGIQGVYVIDSKKPGPLVAVSCCTHGNEPSGLVPIWSELRYQTFSRFLAAGKVAFILNNPVAAIKSFECASIEERSRCRFIDINMNRMPEDALEGPSGNAYEVLRLRQLMPLYKDVEIALDIHSTSQDSPPMILEIKNFKADLARGFGISPLLTNISEIQVGLPIGYFIGGLNGSSPVVEIEAGQHFATSSFLRALRCAGAFLRNTGVMSSDWSEDWQFGGGGPGDEPALREYKIVSSVLFPDESFLLEEVFPDFGFVNAGDVLARGQGSPIIAECAGHTFFATPQRRPASIREEALFLSAPVREVSSQ
jgi:hypothetical protein